MQRALQGRYAKIATAGQTVRAFTPAPLPPSPAIATAGSLVAATRLTAATVNKSIEHLARLGIVTELTQRQRGRVFAYAGYAAILAEGTDLP